MSVPRFYLKRPAVASRDPWLLLAACCVLAAIALPAHAQFDRWYQLSEQAVQLKNQGNSGGALPVEQQAERVAETTWGAEDSHVALSLNVLGVLDTELEKFSDAETNLKRALAIFTKLEGSEGKDVATVDDNLGVLYQETANYPAAEKVTQQALAIHEKLLGPNDLNVATDASNLALIYVDESKWSEAEPLYKKAIAIDQKSGKPDQLSTDLGGLGSLYDDMHKFADAEQAFGQALLLDAKVLGQQHPKIGLDLFHLATAYQLEGKFALAEDAYGKAMAIEQKAATPDQATIATIEENVGALFRDEGKYAAAESLFLQALASRAKALGPNHPAVAAILDDLGALYQYESRYSDAERAFRQALIIDTKALGPANIQTAQVMADLAMLYGGHGQWGASDQLYHDAIPIFVRAFGPTDVRLADILFSASDQLLTEGKFNEAESGFTAAAAIFEKAKDTQNRALANCYDRLASIAEDGGKHDLAESLFKRSLDTLEKADGPDSEGLTPPLEGLGRVYKDEQRFADAEPLYQRELKIDQAHSKAEDPALLRASQADLAALYYAWGKPEQAAPYFQSYLGSLMEELRANAATMSERDRLIYFATERNAFPLFFSFVLKFHDQIPELSGQMYDALLEEKGLIAASAAAMRAAVVASGDPQAVSMLDKLASDRAQLAALAESASDPANHRDQSVQLSQEANSLEQSLMKRSAPLTRQQTLNTATWRDVQKTLKPGDAAVEVIRFQFGTGIEVTGALVYVALVVTPDCKEPALVVLGEARDLEAGPMLAYREGVGQTRGISAEEVPPAPGQQPAAPNTAAAYAAFWKPLERALSGVKRVFFAPDGVLNTIPIGLLAGADGKLLMEKIELRIVNSTKDMLLPAFAAQARTALLVGNPKFDLSAAQQRSALTELTSGAAAASTSPQPQQAQAPAQDPATNQAQSVSRGGDLRGGDLNPLPGTQLEVDTVDTLLKSAGWQPAEYSGDLALKQTVTAAHGPRVVHIATHGFFLSDEELTASAEAEGRQANLNEDPMLRSGLFFAGADRVRQGVAPEPGVDDGVLTAFEASQLNLEGTELVVLSACETGLGKELNSDGVFGLRRGLQEAGADAVMMSMWSVPDQETQELMSLFYKNWLSGMDKPEALRQAQLAERETVRKRYGKDLPYYWGAFVMISR